jgi:hypothetical protein
MTHPGFHQMLLQTRTQELRERAAQAAAGRALREAALAHSTPIAVTIRFAGAQDAAALDDLAGLDSARPLLLPALVAEVEGELRAALSLDDGRVVADPFQPTLALAELLRTRARQLAERRDGGWLEAVRHPLRTARAIRGAVMTTI